MGFEGERGRLTCKRRAMFGGKRGACRIVSCWDFFSSVAPVTIRWSALCSS
jgi:hypothetical protein